MASDNRLGNDYSQRSYLSATEAARYLRTSVRHIHELVRRNLLKTYKSASGQMRFELTDLEAFDSITASSTHRTKISVPRLTEISVNGTLQRVVNGNSQRMDFIPSNSVHLMITSPPYFDAKMYSRRRIRGNLGDIHDTDSWFREIGKVWKEVYRVLQPGRKAFINIMNLPVRDAVSGFKSLNLVGKTIDICEEIGFVFKRDIVWNKTNSVRAHFGSYPYPGGILINNSHEFILELEKPGGTYGKYSHLSAEQKSMSKLTREFWLSIKNSDVWLISPEGSGDRRDHVAPFPMELPRRLIRAYSFIGETVLDPFVGSGTTLVAAAELGRNGIGLEIVKEIAAGAIETLNKIGHKAV
ncbi:MAG: DNA methyltransferase [Methanomassiliicoccales archaeon]